MPAKRGRPPKPTALKKLHNAGRRPLNELEPEPPQIAPASPGGNVVPLRTAVVHVEAPPYLVGIALEKWNELAPQMANACVVTAWDRDALARYCVAHKTEVETELELQKLQKSHVLNGLLTKTPNKMLVMSSLLTTRNAAMRDASKFGALLGLDPSSRSGIKAEKPPEANGWEEFV
jgi:P27 family predicted phage terminase small subunit